MPTRNKTDQTPTQVVLHDSHRRIPLHRKAVGKIDPETRAELRIADALSVGAHPDIAPVSRIGFDAALDALALNSKLAIASDINCYVDWCLAEKRTAFPAEAETIVRYIEERDLQKAKPSTIARRIGSIATAHSMLELDTDAVHSRMVKNRLKAIRKKRGAKVRQAQAIRFGDALSADSSPVTIGALLELCSETLTGLRDAAMLSAGYNAGLRVSELCAIQVEDIESAEEGTGSLFIPESKTDQERNGAYAWLSADTMRRIRRWLDAASITEGTVFRRVHVTRKKGKAAEGGHDAGSIPIQQGMAVYTAGTEPLTRQGVNGIYRRIIKEAWAAGLVDVPGGDIAAYIRTISTHSLRVGLTQDLIAEGQDGVAIAQALRWSSPSTAQRYGAQLRVRSGAVANTFKGVWK